MEETIERFERFVLAIERMSKNVKRIEDSELEKYGLRSSHLMCILQLAKHGGLSTVALAKECEVDKAYISRITGELLEKNYISRDTSGEQKYKVKFTLTPEGKRLHREVLEIITRRLLSVNGDASGEELSLFYALLTKIDERISELSKKGD